MVIHFLKEDCLTALKANVAGNLKHYSEPTNDWVYDFFDGENPFQEYKYQIADFDFDLELNENHTQSSQDVENVIRVFSAMNSLTCTQATDERLWAGLAHGDFWPYMHNRWHGENTNVTNIRARYFLGTSAGLRRSLFVNTISRLWWIGKMTYDSDLEDPFELTRYMLDNFSTKSLVMFSSNFTSNPTITRGYFKALLALEKENYTYGKKSRDVFYQVSKYLNLFGGTHILDYYSEDEIRDKIINYMHTLQ